MGIVYKATMCPAIAGKFVERFAETLASSLATLNGVGLLILEEIDIVW